MARRQEIVEVEHFQWVDDAQPIEAIKFPMGRLAHLWVHVYGINRLGVRMLLHHASNRAEHAMHGLAKVLTTMCSD